MFLNIQSLQLALEVIEPFHMFFGTTFLVFKKAQLPIGNTMVFAIDTEDRKFLDKYYKPKGKSNWYYRPMRSVRKDQHWLDRKYPGGGSQSTRTKSKIAAAFVHETDSQIWGWQTDYVTTLQKQLRVRIPILALAIWIYRDRLWDSNYTAQHIIETFVNEFNITEEELKYLFDASIPETISEVELFQDQEITWDELEKIISSPPDSPPGEEGTLTYLQLNGVGPATELEFIPAERLNLITGDNGLGKTFILECAWWALTGQWVGFPAYPRHNLNQHEAKITFEISGRTGKPERKSISYKEGQGWLSPQNRPTIPGLLVYARVDSSFAVWDPERSDGVDKSPRSLSFSKDEVWQGLPGSIRGNSISYSEGLLRDWIQWQKNPEDSPFQIFKQILRHLSPRDLRPLEPGKPVMIPLDSREIPTLAHLYGETPIIYAAAGLKRIVAVAYIIVWAWSEHRRLSQAHKKPPLRRMVILIDEIEAHLHPRWQRVILRALLGVSKMLSSELEIQFIIATHSPLVMTSVEPHFNLESDKIFHLNLTQGNLFEGEVVLEELPFIKYGPADSWLMSDVFATSPRSIEAEDAIQQARKIQQEKFPDASQIKTISEQLRNFLASDDEFWPLWKYFAEQHGVKQ